MADAKANPNKVIYSSSGLYGALAYSDRAVRQVGRRSQMRHLPTNGGGPAVTAVLGGNVNFFMSPTSIALTHIRAGKVRAAGGVEREARQDAARRADLQGAGLRPRILFLGRHIRAEGHAGAGHQRAARRPQQGRAQQAIRRHARPISARSWPIWTSRNSPTFWAADAKRQEDAINSIGRVQG